jgi:preprotein translocase subunit SecE
VSDSAPAAASGAGGAAAEGASPARSPREKDGHKRSLFARVALFVRQVVAELKKVVRPTRSELFTYTGVVLVFVLVVMAFVTVLDLGIGQVTLWVFGD